MPEDLRQFVILRRCGDFSRFHFSRVEPEPIAASHDIPHPDIARFARYWRPLREHDDIADAVLQLLDLDFQRFRRFGRGGMRGCHYGAPIPAGGSGAPGGRASTPSGALDALPTFAAFAPSTVPAARAIGP